LFGVFSPPQPSFAKIAILECEEELIGCLDRSIIFVFLIRSGSDPLENLLAQGLTSNCSDHIDCGFLPPDVGDPLKEDVLLLGDIDIASLALLHRGKRCLEISFDLISVSFSCVEAFRQGLDLLSLHPSLLFTSMN